MYRLHNKAFEILREEIEVCSSNDKKGKQKRLIALKRLQQMRLNPGRRAKLNELRDAVVDVFPIFSETALKEAAKANRKPSIFGKFKYLAIGLTGVAGVVTVLNLPHPNIRWFVAKTAPILLVPSHMNMDFHYWGARNSVQEAQIMLKSAANFSDIKQVENKIAEAEQHLSHIPIWFLGYYPEVYCQNFSCSWNFSFDEFENIRTQIIHLETKTIREKQAFIPLVEAQQVYRGAKRKLSIAKTQKQKQLAMFSMQSAIKTIAEVPSGTLAKKKAETQLKAYKRYYEQVAQKK
ncbi:MAG: hypothetical protein KI793_24925 [Rivularia sp. (in: Bacteria)]|nr:hypothetical protein [Rivularia sp. MS3]